MIDPTSIHMKTHMFFYLHQSKLNDIAHDSMQKRNNFSIFLPIIISSQNWIQESKKYEEEKTLFLLGFDFFLFSPLSLHNILLLCFFHVEFNFHINRKIIFLLLFWFVEEAKRKYEEQKSWIVIIEWERKNKVFVWQSCWKFAAPMLS